MSSSKYLIGGAIVVAALVSVVPLFKNDFAKMQMNSKMESNQQMATPSSASIATTSNSSDVIGSYNGIQVLKSQLDGKEKQSLFDAESQKYKAEEGILAKRFLDSMILAYAKDKKISDMAEAQHKYIEENVHVSDSQVKSFIEQNKDNPQLQGKSLTDQINLVKPYLMQKASYDYIKSVTQKAIDEGNIIVTDSKIPEMPRVNVETANYPSLGNDKAPVTIVEFADFQCPFCNAAEPTLSSIMKKYNNKVRLVFRNYPLIQLHPQAVSAAIAAECAYNQNRFWDMHKVLFENHSKLADNVYEQYAKQIGLNMGKFETCFKDPKVKDKVMADADYGQSLGINATPAFFINGQMLMGAVPESEFTALIDKELKGPRG